MKQRVLVVAHNHPDFHPGGTEIFAHDLFQAYKRAGCEAFFLGATNKLHREPHPGTSLQAIPGAADEAILWAPHFDRFMISQVDLHGVVPDLVALLRTLRPTFVHFHHLLLVGAEFPALVRRILPDAHIVLTLHDYYPICVQDGVMVRKTTGERCLGADPHRCRECFPEVPANRFKLRELHLKTHLAAVDRFVAPSAFLKQRYVQWGLPEAMIEVLPNGFSGVGPALPRPAPGGRRNSFGYFGNFNPWKGVDVLLESARQAAEAGLDFHLRLHGAARFQTDEYAARIDAAISALGSRVSRLGPYRREDIPGLMSEIDWVVVPSVWWENAPLTISEAQFHRRPVIASGIGGMAELVRDGINGLNVRPGDARSLAQAMTRAASDPDLWPALSAGAIAPPSMDDVAIRHLTLFESLSSAAAA